MQGCLFNRPTMQDPDEFDKKWNARLNAYAWVLFFIAAAVLMNAWSDEIAQWVQKLRITG